MVAIGLALAVGCGALVAFEHDPAERRRRRIAPGAALAALSALAFGAFFVGTNAASDAGGVAWTVAVNRSTSFAALALAVVIGRKGLTYGSADLRPAAVIGLLDAGANALFALALTQGMTSTVGVIGSLYPVTTVVLATVILRERPRALQALGVVGGARRRRSRDRLDRKLEPQRPGVYRSGDAAQVSARTSRMTVRDAC